MKNRSICRWLMPPVLMLVLLASEAGAQRRFPYQLDLDSRSLDTLHTPDATLPDHQYRITAWGTYSMWEDTVNSSVDPMWIYSFPAEEWAKPEWRAFPEGYPIYVGDSRLLNSHGLRINDAPMPQTPLNAEHRYSMIIRGTGAPLSATIVDWNFRNLVKRDAHDNNSGWLHVYVEELPNISLDVCGIDSSAFPTIRVALKAFKDSVRIEDLAGRIVLRENGQVVRIDRIDCSERASSVSVAMVFDRSGSMREAFGNSTRIDNTIQAGKRFARKLAPGDEAAIFSFDETTTLDQSWTSNVAELETAIDALTPGGWTAMNDAVMVAINAAEARPASRRKAIVVLSDGEDNRSDVRDVQTVIARARRAGIPVFTIGLLLDSDDSLRILAAQTGGKYFSVREAAAMDSVFASIADIVFEKGCCSVYYTTPDGHRNGSYRAVLPSLTDGSDTVNGRLLGYHAPGNASGVERETAPAGAAIVTVAPNPLQDDGILRYRVARGGRTVVDVLDVAGKVVMTVSDEARAGGEYEQPLSLRGLPNGRYFVRVQVPGETSIQPIVLAR